MPTVCVDISAFYEKCGYEHKEYQMVRYFDNRQATVSRL